MGKLFAEAEYLQTWMIRTITRRFTLYLPVREAYSVIIITLSPNCLLSPTYLIIIVKFLNLGYEHPTQVFHESIVELVKFQKPAHYSHNTCNNLESNNLSFIC
jgi:hypothetical protein